MTFGQTFTARSSVDAGASKWLIAYCRRPILIGMRSWLSPLRRGIRLDLRAIHGQQLSLQDFDEQCLKLGDVTAWKLADRVKLRQSAPDSHRGRILNDATWDHSNARYVRFVDGCRVGLTRGAAGLSTQVIWISSSRPESIPTRPDSLAAITTSDPAARRTPISLTSDRFVPAGDETPVAHKTGV